MAFDGRILVLGCGSVSQCTLPLLLKEGVVTPERVTVLDMVDHRARVARELARGVTYVDDQITPENLGEVLGRHLRSGDICIDLAWNIDCCEILQWCRDHGVRYLNTSVELWDPYEGGDLRHPLDRTLYVRHMAMRRMIRSWGDNRGPTAVVEHGANPGLVSHFAKQALVEISDRALGENVLTDAETGAVEAAREAGDFARLAMALGVKVIHIAERDTQITDRPKEVDEFVNTWSVEGFYEEGIAPAELGWGTHERRLPPGAWQHHGEGPGNQIALAQPGMTTWVRSWVPWEQTIGMVIRHGEAFTMCDHLTVWDGERAVYRPTVHYAYCPADVAIASVHELQMRQWDMQPRQRILNDEIVSGADKLGVLLMGHRYRAWWTGSLLTIGEARALVPHQNATTLQVAASVLACVQWMIDHPHEGVRVPDDLPYDYVLQRARPYLGSWWSGPADWDPVTSAHRPFGPFESRVVDAGDPWQFTNFLL